MSDDRRREILRAASAMFDSVGYHRASLSELAKEANMAKATLYHYYKSKSEILFTIHQVLIAEMIRSHEERVQREASAGEVLLGTMTDVLRLMKSDRGGVRVFFENGRELTEEQRTAVVAERDRFNKMVEATFARGHQTGELRAVDPVVATRALFGMCNWAYQWYRADGRLSPDELAIEFWSLFRDGVKSEVNTK